MGQRHGPNPTRRARQDPARAANVSFRVEGLGVACRNAYRTRACYVAWIITPAEANPDAGKAREVEKGRECAHKRLAEGSQCPVCGSDLQLHATNPHAGNFAMLEKVGKDKHNTHTHTTQGQQKEG